MESAANKADSENMVVPETPITTICAALSTGLGGGKVSLAGSTAYNVSVASYFSQQQQAVQPACVVSPQTTQDVSTAIRILTSHTDGQCKFSIRSGGHASWAGASNIAGGVVIDIRALNSVDVHSDTSTVSVGAGAAWDDVYAKLDPVGRSVNGGRAAEVGVGGLTLGGGISYFSPRYGWTCDTVTSLQIVLADASIVEVDAESDPALFQALKGGNNNFGVVTRIDFRTFEQGLIWAGRVYNDLSLVDQVIAELVKIASAEAYDEYASMIVTFGYAQARNMAIISSTLDYTKAVESPPKYYQSFLEIPSLMNTSELVNMTSLAKTTRGYSPQHPRSINRVLTLMLTEPVLKAAYAAWDASLDKIRDLRAPCQGKRSRPDWKEQVFGSNAFHDHLVGRVDDALVNEATHNLMAAIEDAARQIGDLDPYIYLNYADKDQDPIASYGAASVSRLQEVRDRVDPRGVFTYQVPGGFKIERK
ncbi:hypothetical protein E0Z10_g6569 [Xylaria hypoxylon]|uniref:FAD-binding PCMH-type domain-containing protein n=1 Tax=Xylaria hypoxylon TaxID=37992 RepID=A0A4Z0YXR0_9PEZI|nr:hypothetical protein E0Z10_g6569 [Xylaria hypoxylon]